MPSFTAKDLPPQALPDLKRIAELDEGLFAQFLAAISATGPTLTSDQFGTRVLEKSPLIKEHDVRAMVRGVFFLYSKMSSPEGELSPEEMARMVSSSPLWATLKDFSHEKKTTLSSRLIRLLSFPKTVGVSSKAHEVMA